jgi:hypothetical protein
MIHNFGKFLENKENKELRTIEGTLPYFTGFYNTPFGEFDSQEMDNIETYNDENDTNLSFDDFEWEYQDALNDVAKLCFDTLEPLIIKLPFVEKVTYVDLYSPKEYNYRNDQINVDYLVDYDKMIKYFIGNLTLSDIENYDYDEDAEYKNEFIDNCIKSDYTSRPGFTSYYSNDIQEWLKDLLKDNLSDTQITSLIEYALYYENEISEDYNDDVIHDDDSLFNAISEEFALIYPKMTPIK